MVLCSSSGVLFPGGKGYGAEFMGISLSTLQKERERVRGAADIEPFQARRSRKRRKPASFSNSFSLGGEGEEWGGGFLIETCKDDVGIPPPPSSLLVCQKGEELAGGERELPLCLFDTLLHARESLLQLY